MKRLLIKLSGELFSDKKALVEVVKQIKTISENYSVAIVVGGGNFFRGALDNGELALQSHSAHNVGMLSTIVNAIILRDILLKANVSSVILSAFPVPTIAGSITDQSIDAAFSCKHVIIFTGGTGSPFFTTDTTAILRALQIGADEAWKGTKVDGVYSADPLKDKNSTFYPVISYQDVLEKNLGVIDQTAITLARENKLPIRVFNIFTKDSLLKVLKDKDFGSIIDSFHG